ERPIQCVTARAQPAPNAKCLALHSPMRCLRLGGILQSSALPTSQTVDPVEDAGGPPATWAREPLAVAAEHRRCVRVGHEMTSNLTLVTPLDEPDACRVRNDAQLVEPAISILPCDGPDATTHNNFEQSHTPEISQIDCTPMLNLARCTELYRSPRAYATHRFHPRFCRNHLGVESGQGLPVAGENLGIHG